MNTRTRPGMDAAISAMVELAQSHGGSHGRALAFTRASSLVIEPRHHPLEPLHVRQAAKRPVAPARRQEPAQRPATARVAIGDRSTLARAARARRAARKDQQAQQAEDALYSKFYKEG